MPTKGQAHESCEGSDGAMKKDELLKKCTPEQLENLSKFIDTLKQGKLNPLIFHPPFRSEPTFWDKAKAFLGIKKSDSLL